MPWRKLQHQGPWHVCPTACSKLIVFTRFVMKTEIMRSSLFVTWGNLIKIAQAKWHTFSCGVSVLHKQLRWKHRHGTVFPLFVTRDKVCQMANRVCMQLKTRQVRRTERNPTGERDSRCVQHGALQSHRALRLPNTNGGVFFTCYAKWQTMEVYEPVLLLWYLASTHVGPGLVLTPPQPRPWQQRLAWRGFTLAPPFPPSLPGFHLSPFHVLPPLRPEATVVID